MRRLLATAMVVTAWGILLLGFFPVLDYFYPSDSEAARDTAPRTRTLRLLEDFQMTSQDERGISHAISGDAAVVKPRRFFVFNMKSINEMHIANGKVDLYLHTDVDVEKDLLSVDPTFFAPDSDGPGFASLPKHFGAVTRLVVDDLVARIYEDGQLKVTAVANAGYLRSKQKQPELMWTTLSNPGKTRRVVTKKAIWDKQEKVFRIPGNYKLYTKDGTVQANGAKVDLDLEVSPFQRFPAQQGSKPPRPRVNQSDRSR